MGIALAADAIVAVAIGITLATGAMVAVAMGIKLATGAMVAEGAADAQADRTSINMSMVEKTILFFMTSLLENFLKHFYGPITG